MKTLKNFSLLLIFLLLPGMAVSGIPGRYELIAPRIPPEEHSLDVVTMHEVFAFSCGHCFDFTRIIAPRLKEKFGKKLEIIPQPIGWAGHDPGKLYFIAKEKGIGNKVKLMIFNFHFNSGVNMYDRDKLRFVAKMNGLSEEFKTRMDSPEIVAKMKESVQFAEINNITSTPTLVIENSIIPVRDYTNLVTIINALLKEPVK